MNVFDFDNTIYRGDSTGDFIFFCFGRHPKTLLYIPRIAYSAMRFYLFHQGDKTEFKERLYSLLKACNVKEDVNLFWQKHLDKINNFYHDLRHDDDIVISASPEFLLKPLEKKLNIRVIASRVDMNTGKYDGLNCHHQEKVRRLKEEMGDITIDSFYSDSYADEPLALLADKAYIVKGSEITDWDFTCHKRRLHL